MVFRMLQNKVDARQKRWGKRFRAVLADIAKVRNSGDPLIEFLAFFFPSEK